MPDSSYNTDDIARRGREIYEQRIQSHVEAERTGEFLILDVDSADYEIDADRLQAIERLKARRPAGQFYIIAIGAPFTVTLGGTNSASA